MLLLGLVGLYTSQAEEAGILGLAGFIFVFFLGALGWILFGVATLRAHVYPRWAAVLLIVDVLGAFALVPLAGIVFSGAVAWMGFILFTGRFVSVEEPSRVS